MKKQTQLVGKKITLATLKSFIKEDGLFLRVKSSFDGMTDMVEPRKSEFEPVQPDPYMTERTLGIKGMWCVGESRDYFTYHNDGVFEGIEVYNSCGSCVIARKLS